MKFAFAFEDPMKQSMCGGGVGREKGRLKVMAIEQYVHAAFGQILRKMI